LHVNIVLALSSLHQGMAVVSAAQIIFARSTWWRYESLYRILL